MKKFDGIDLKRLIIGSVAGVIISLAIGLVLFWLTIGTVKAYDGGVFSAGYTELSFIVGVLVASALFGLKQNDVISAGILGFIISLITSLLEGFVLKMFWDPMNIQFIIGWWGNHTAILIFVGIMASIGFNLLFSRKNSLNN